MTITTTALSGTGVPIGEQSSGAPIKGATHRLGPLEALSSEFYSQFLSNAARSLKPSAIRNLFPLEKQPGMLSMLAGKPNGTLFPFRNLRFDAPDPQDPSLKRTITIDPELLADGLQYTNTEGLASFVEWLTALQELEHQRSRVEGWRITTTVGSQDALHKAITAIHNPGDCVIVERPCYTGAISLFNLAGCEMIEVESDAHGIKTSALRSLLTNWPSSKPKPKSFYTVPYGGNPTGVTATLERRLEVLKLARQHNFLILEDDPYYYLYFGSTPRPPSYFSLEASGSEVGRVLRFDSFSKVLSAGLRIGFVTGPRPLINAIDTHSGNTNLQASSFTHCVALSLLREWGYEGFKAHTHRISAFYQRRRNVFEAALREHLGGLIEWSTPEAGMFIWFKIRGREGRQIDAADLIGRKASAAGVLALPGSVFFAKEERSSYVRASFSILEEQHMEEALRRLRDVILTEYTAI